MDNNGIMQIALKTRKHNVFIYSRHIKAKQATDETVPVVPTTSASVRVESSSEIQQCKIKKCKSIAFTTRIKNLDW